MLYPGRQLPMYVGTSPGQALGIYYSTNLYLPWDKSRILQLVQFHFQLVFHNSFENVSFNDDGGMGD